MRKFVGVRLVQANGLDLKLFQFDWDLTFAVFFLNADRTIYGRFGTRSHHEDAERDISLEGFNKAMAGALELHRDYAAVKASLAGKTGPAPRHERPEQYPTLRQFRPTFDFAAKGHNCMHCHQLGDAERQVYRTAGKPIPDEALFPYPMPDVIGLKLDPQEKAKVVEVAADSAAAKAGLKRGDELVSLEGQPLLSIADVQWVLHNVRDNGTEPAKLKAKARRGGETVDVSLTLEQGWRRRGDISWRATSWELRRMATGGLVLEELPEAARRKLALDADALALRVKYVGQFGPHAVGRDAGFRVGDVIIQFDKLKDRATESQLLAWAVQNLKPKDRPAVTILRGNQRMELRLLQQ